MSSLFPEELALASLRGKISDDERGYMPREAVLKLLRELTGANFPAADRRWEELVAIRNPCGRYSTLFPAIDSNASMDGG